MKYKNLFLFFSFMIGTILIVNSMDNAQELTDPVKILPRIHDELKKSGITKGNWNIDKTHMQTAAVLYARYYVIGQQDAACCCDDNTHRRLKSWIQQQPFHRAITHTISSRELKHIFQEQCDWVKEHEENNGIKHSLDWIERYSFDFFDGSRTIKIPREQWNEKRAEVLLELKKEFRTK